MQIAAGIFLGTLVLAGLWLMVDPRPWRAIPPIDSDDDGRPTDDYPTAQALHDLQASVDDLKAAVIANRGSLLRWIAVVWVIVVGVLAVGWGLGWWDLR